MDDEVKKGRLLQALGVVLEPVIRLMLKGGVTWKEFSELSKAKFVEVATADFGIRGRPTNASRVAILTGLDRRDVRKLREAAAAQELPAKGYMSKASQVLSSWYHDADFLGPDREPRAVALDGEGPTVAELIRRHAPGLPMVAMVKELKAAGAIEELADGRLRPLTRAYVPQQLPQEQLRLWSSVLSDIANTIEHNFEVKSDSPRRFERRALNLKVDRRALPEFQRLLEKEGQALLERIDDWLTAHEVQDADRHDDAIRLGVGMYHIEDRRKHGRGAIQLGNASTQ
jgi:hypothetical protein